jgi:hypothetical protein
MTKKLVLLLIGICAGVPSMGQNAPVHSAVTHRVKIGQYAEWQDLRRQVVDIYKKAGTERAQLVYSTLSGPYEYLFVQHYPKWEDLGAGLNPKLKDSAAQLASLNARMLNTLDNMSRNLGRVSDLSYGMKEEPAPMIQVVRITVKPGMGRDYVNLIRSDIQPAYKKAGVKTFVLITPSYGEGVVTYTIPRSWKDLDEGNPLVKVLGEDGYAALMKKSDALVVKRQVDLYQYRPGLSYRPGAAEASGGAN